MRPFLTALAAAGLFAWAWTAASPALYRPGEAIDTDVFHSGEMILHGIKYSVTKENYHLPLSSISSALLFNHSPEGAGAVWRSLSAALAFLLLLVLGCELGAPWFGLLGVAALLYVTTFPFESQLTESWHGSWGHLQSFFTLIVLVMAGLAVRHARAPSLRNAVLTALALGATLLYRSTLVFFPPLLALYHWRTLRRRPTREDWKSLAVLGLAPYLFLLPWIAMNWAVHRRFIPLEDGEASPIIVGGVLGVIEKEWARPPAALGIHVTGTGETLLWAVGQVLSNPADYLAGYFSRLVYVLDLSPLLFIFAALSFYVNRRKKEFQVLGLFCAYFALIHCFMSILREYFDPLWPPLAALAAAGIAAAVKTPPSAPGRRASGIVLGATLAAVLALCLYVDFAVARYAYFVTRGDAAAAQRRLDATIARHPKEGALYIERAIHRLENGAVAEALADLRPAHALNPAHPLAERLLIWSELHQGDASRFKRRGAALADPALQAYGRMILGEKAAADRHLAELLASPGRPSPIALPPFVESMCARVREYRRLRPVCAEHHIATAEIAARTPSLAEVERRLSAAAALAPNIESRRRMIQLSLDLAGSALRKGDARSCLRFLSTIEPLQPNTEDRRRMVRLYRQFEAYGPAQASLARIAQDTPQDAAPWIERADIAARTARPREAAAFLDEARKRNPDDVELLLIAQLTPPAAAREPRPSEEAGLIARTLDSHLRRAAAAVLAGERAKALELLASARILEPDSASRLRIVSLYGELKEYAPARPLLDELIRNKPADPGLRVERAAFAAGAGDRTAALAFLSEARARSPSPRDRLRMAYLHQELKDYAPALSLFAALAAEKPRDAALRGDLGLCRYLAGRTEAAIDDLAAAIELDPALWPASLTLGSIHAAQGRHERAIAVYDRALREAGGRPVELKALLLRARKEALQAGGR